MWEKTKIFIAIGKSCVGEPWSKAPCREVWISLSVTALIFVLAGITLLLAVRRWRVLAMRRATRRLTQEYLDEQQRVADDFTMQQFKWKGENTDASAKDTSVITGEIREALKDRQGKV